ncbi:MAG: hypothetical protein SGILL_010239 [Bacillariaceae sp.]
MAAKVFISDAFPISGNSNFIATAFKDKESSNSPAFEWSVQLQGPLIILEQQEDENFNGTQYQAKSIVPFAGADDLVGFAVGSTNELVDIAVASPSSLIPRFTHETWEDGGVLDTDLPTGICVNRIDLSNTETATSNIQLIPDPIMECVVHLVTPEHIMSVSTNTARVAANKAREASSPPASQGMFSPPSRRSDLEPKTTAWSCLDVSFFQGKQNPVVGAVISNDVQLGHVLVARLLNGNVIAVNLTEKRHLSEMDSATSAKAKALPAIEAGVPDTESLADTIKPTLQMVYEGLAKLRQVGGSATPPEKMTLEDLGAAMDIHKSCKMEVYLPLVEMNEIVNARREELKEKAKKQMEAVKALQNLIGKLREKQRSIQERTQTVSQNAKSLSERSGSVLQASIDCQPTITQAEYDFFQDLKSKDLKVLKDASEVERFKLKAMSIGDSIENGTTAGPVSVSEETAKNLHLLLRGATKGIQRFSDDLDEQEGKFAQIAAFSGMIAEPTG